MGIIERREREKKQRQDAIIDAAEKVFFSKGVDTATMDDVAEAAELSKGTLYLYFKSKEELYLAITKRALEILTDMFSEATKKQERGIDKVQAIGRAYITFSKKFPDYFNSMIYFESHIKDLNGKGSSAQACDLQGEKALGVLVEALQIGIEDESIRSEIDPLKVAVILWGQSTGILQLISIKGKHMKEHHDLFGFKNLDDLIDHSFKLTRYSLEKKSKGD